MPRVIPNRIEAGDVMETSNHDVFLNTLVTSSLSLGSATLRNECITKDHLTIHAFTPYSSHMAKTNSTVYEHSGSSFTVISDGITPCKLISIATTMSQGDVLTVNSSVEMRHPVSASGNEDQRRLRYYFRYDTGAGPTTVETFMPGSPMFVYGTRDVLTGAVSTEDRLDNDKNVQSWVYIHTQSPDFVIQEVQLRCATLGTGDIIEFKHWNMSVQIDKH